MTKSTSVTRGFTIVELLIVIVVIAILAAISIVAYNGIQTRANDSAVKQDVANITKKLELFRIDSPSGIYPSSATQLATLDLRISGKAYDTAIARNLVYCTDSTYNNYGLAFMAKNGSQYYITNSTNTAAFPAAWTTGSAAATICTNMNAAFTYVTMGYNNGWIYWTNYSG